VKWARDLIRKIEKLEENKFSIFFGTDKSKNEKIIEDRE
jgi:hypothetical protein